MTAMANRVAASRKAAQTRAKMLSCGAGYGPKGSKRGRAGAPHSIPELLARIRAQAAEAADGQDSAQGEAQ